MKIFTHVHANMMDVIKSNDFKFKSNLLDFGFAPRFELTSGLAWVVSYEPKDGLGNIFAKIFKRPTNTPDVVTTQCKDTEWVQLIDWRHRLGYNIHATVLQLFRVDKKIIGVHSHDDREYNYECTIHVQVAPLQFYRAMRNYGENYSSYMNEVLSSVILSKINERLSCYPNPAFHATFRNISNDQLKEAGYHITELIIHYSNSK